MSDGTDEPRDGTAGPDRPDEDAPGRGGDPDDGVGRNPQRIPPKASDTWVPSGESENRWKAVRDTIAGGRRPRREDVLPFLLIRGFSPGDRGQRPLWPPVPTWESPDILLIDAGYTGPFDQVRLVGSPTAGGSYRVFVHVWNLGLFPAVGVHVRAWHVNPGFFNVGSSGYQPIPIGGALIDLEDRTRAGCHRIVELDQPWTVPAGTQHECMLASVTCPGDPWSGLLDANADRHVGQRNLSILVGDEDASELLTILGGMLPMNATLEIVHAGTAGTPTLQAVTGGALPRPAGTDGPFDEGLDIAPLAALRHGVGAEDGQHLLVMRREPRRSLFARSDALAELARVGQGNLTVEHLHAARPVSARGAAARPTLRHDDTRHILAQLGDAQLEEVAASTAQPAGLALTQAFAGVLGISDLRARTAATALTGRAGQQHPLRFIATDSEDRLVGGYTVVIA